MDSGFEQPSWLFYLGWIALSTLAILLTFDGENTNDRDYFNR